MLQLKRNGVDDRQFCCNFPPPPATVPHLGGELSIRKAGGILGEYPPASSLASDYHSIKVSSDDRAAALTIMNDDKSLVYRSGSSKLLCLVILLPQALTDVCSVV